MEGAGRSGMDRYRALVIPGFLVLSFSRRKSRDKRARFAPLPIPSLRWLASLLFQTKGKKLAGVGRGMNVCWCIEEKNIGALDAPGWIGIGRSK
ncbi:hypothetical protein SAMN05720606_11266 [Paenibacillus polysaccharolyticus]|uniref:Uncharacterized protein n=1 Tax=Paenibacillus polysaccharolyticus TaxID=582692 RepID=A0A1G5JWK5_9BACL|nr:hypothetical protein [Paenibacillus polysaccharolyticus]SCY92250.1 hypothetical protein SAMN05720606_11266 [Paenibacillus polysaccharolyticus]